MVVLYDTAIISTSFCLHYVPISRKVRQILMHADIFDLSESKKQINRNILIVAADSCSVVFICIKHAIIIIIGN